MLERIRITAIAIGEKAAVLIAEDLGIKGV